jgi:predicted Ser/Thr protein kinase
MAGGGNPANAAPGQDDAPPVLLSQGYQGTVYLAREAGQAIIIKRACGSWLTGWLRRFMLNREYSAYQRLRGIHGVPACHGLTGKDELRLQFIEGRSLRDAGYVLPDPQAFFDSLLARVQSLHEAGVAHADLKRKDNILVDDQFQPWLIDFGSAVFRPARSHGLGGFFFRQACRMDLNAWFKIKYQFIRETPTAADRMFYQPTFIERAARVLRRAWRRITVRNWRNSRG